MVRINTRRLVVRNFILDDWPDLLAIAIDKESSRYAAFDHSFPTAEDEVKGMAAFFAQGDDFLAVSELNSGRVIGYIALNEQGPGERNLGYSFHSAYQHKGYATEACIAAVNYAFTSMGAQRLTSGTANVNEPSLKLLARLGFHKLGENVTSFRSTPEGRPVEFTGCSFLIEKEDWARQGYSQAS